MNNAIIIVLVFFIVAFTLIKCIPKEDFSYMDKPYEQVSKELIGVEAYEKIRDGMIEDYKSYTALKHPDLNDHIHIYPILCFNTERNRYVAAYVSKSATQASLSWMLGFKYSDSWQYFKKNVATAMFFEEGQKLTEDTTGLRDIEILAKKYLLNGYLSKNKITQEYEINDKYFEGLFEGHGWGYRRDTLANGDIIKTQDSAHLLSAYMRQVNRRKKEFEELKRKLNEK